MGILCTVVAMVVMLLGAWRFMRQQAAMVRGKVHAGGWDLYCSAGLSSVVLVVLFVVTLVVSANPGDD